MLRREGATPPKEHRNHVAGREAVLARFHGRKAPSAHERERQQQLVRQIRAGKGAGFQIACHAADRALCHALRRHAKLAKAADDLCAMLEPSLKQHDVARPLILRQFAHETFAVGSVEPPLRSLDFPVGNVERQPRKISAGAPLQQRAAFDAVDRCQRSRGDIHLDPTAPTRVEAVVDQPRFDARPHAIDDRQEDSRDASWSGSFHARVARGGRI